MFWSNTPTRSTSSLARLLTRCACFVMVRWFYYHMPVGMCAIVTEHGVGTHRFRSTLCSALDLVSFPLGRTSVLGLELGTRLPFVVWITDEIAPLSVGSTAGAASIPVTVKISNIQFCQGPKENWPSAGSRQCKSTNTWKKRAGGGRAFAASKNDAIYDHVHVTFEVWSNGNSNKATWHETMLKHEHTAKKTARSPWTRELSLIVHGICKLGSTTTQLTHQSVHSVKNC